MFHAIRSTLDQAKARPQARRFPVPVWCTAAASGLLWPGLAAAQDTLLVADYNNSQIVQIAYPSGIAQTHFVGSGMTPASGIEGMTFGPDGNLYFASYLTNAVLRVDGRTGYPFGATPVFVVAGSGGLTRPIGIAFGPDGRFYAASNTTNSILVYNGTTGAFINTFVVAGSGSLAGPWGIAFHGSDLFVCSNTNAKVLRYNGTTGAFIDEAITAGQAGLTGAKGILFDSGGRMYITGGNAIVVKDPVAGVSLLCSNATIPLLNAPEQPTLAADGSLLVPCHNGTVQKIDRMSGSSLGTLVQNGAGGMSNSLESVLYIPATAPCYANCDNSTATPVLNVSDFICFLNRYAGGCP